MLSLCPFLALTERFDLVPAEFLVILTVSLFIYIPVYSGLIHAMQSNGPHTQVLVVFNIGLIFSGISRDGPRPQVDVCVSPLYVSFARSIVFHCS